MPKIKKIPVQHWHSRPTAHSMARFQDWKSNFEYLPDPSQVPTMYNKSFERP